VRMAACERRVDGPACALHMLRSAQECRRLLGRACPFHDSRVVPAFLRGRERSREAKLLRVSPRPIVDLDSRPTVNL
jgi:hypothetical protein